MGWGPPESPGGVHPVSPDVAPAPARVGPRATATTGHLTFGGTSPAQSGPVICQNRAMNSMARERRHVGKYPGPAETW